MIGVREGGTQAMRFDVVRVPAEQSLGDYLNSGWMENVDKSSTEDIMINGFPAASASAHGDQWQFKVYALRFGSDVYRFIFASKQKTAYEISECDWSSDVCSSDLVKVSGAAKVKPSLGCRNRRPRTNPSLGSSP